MLIANLKSLSKTVILTAKPEIFLKRITKDNAYSKPRKLNQNLQVCSVRKLKIRVRNICRTRVNRAGRAVHKPRRAAVLPPALAHGSDGWSVERVRHPPYPRI